MSLRSFRYFSEYAAVAAVGFLLRVLPLFAAQGVALVLARAGYAIMGKRRREAKRRLRSVMGETATSREIAEAAWISFRNVVFNAVDMFRIRSFTKKDAERRIEDLRVAVDHIGKVLASANGRGAILALPHCGNWDLVGSAVFLLGVPIFSVAGKQRNPWTNRYINRLREGRGMTVLERGESGGRTYVEMLRRIRRGEVFAILPDTRSRTPALETPFLGGTANIARGMGLLACQTGAPVIPLVIRRTSWRRFIVDFFPTVRPDVSADRDAEERRITREVLAHFDSAIRATPEQWFWYNKRWVLDPVEPVPPDRGGKTRKNGKTNGRKGIHVKIFSHLSFVVFLLALALQFLVVRDAEPGVVANMDALQRDRAAERAALGSGETAEARAPEKAFLGDFRNEMRQKAEKAAGGKATVPQLALGALVLALVLWAVAILRREDRPYYGTNAVLLAVFCAVRWFNHF